MSSDIEPIAVPAADPAHPVALELLQSIVDVARAIFGAQASSVFLLDEETGELVFRAVSGQGEEFLVGRRFPAGQGIAGWVAVSGESIVVDDLTANSAFDRSLAQSTQFVPDALMAAPLVHGDQVLGVLEILDPSAQARSGLPELDLLSMFARQAAIALRIVTADRAATTTDAHAMSPGRRTAAAQLIRELERLLEIQ